ncbi:MAG TPA: hypothetical protein VK501_10385 [Baekduia sp.]|uniref:hypothetical protein n=1 Tax=Baekduia sp. TaxID=2600305 RepID=UPI002B6C6394|nr:hypothetical protein [Baekduia sp.]HMJ34316.1 hypothetical protein [Baekduia sp.]
MERSLPIYASTATRRGRGRGWSSRRRRRWLRRLRPALLSVTVSALALLALGTERALG